MTDFELRVQKNCVIDKTSNPITCSARTPYTDVDLQPYKGLSDPVAMLCILANRVCSAECKHAVTIASEARGNEIVCWSGDPTSVTSRNNTPSS